MSVKYIIQIMYNKKFLFAVIGIVVIGMLFLPIIPTTITVFEEISYQKEPYERPIIHVVTNHSLDVVYKLHRNYIKSEITIINADHYNGEVQVSHNIYILQTENQSHSKLDLIYIDSGKTHTSSVLIPINRQHTKIKVIYEFDTIGKNITDYSRVRIFDIVEKEKGGFHSVFKIFINAISILSDNIFYEIWKYNPHFVRHIVNHLHESIDARVPTTQELTPPILAKFFDGFDINRNVYLDVEESKLFFFWVEQNIAYRFDSETAILQSNSLSNAIIGDGRYRSEYWQTPYETWTERAGDCEDMAILQIAFHNNFNISSKMGLVATEIPGEINHAIAIVEISDNLEDFVELLGDIKYFKIYESYYMLVDNAYSNEFGALSREPIKGTFYIYKIYSLEEAVLQDRIARRHFQNIPVIQLKV